MLFKAVDCTRAAPSRASFASILTFAWSGMIISALAFYYGYLTAWITIPLIAIFASLTHELEHDLRCDSLSLQCGRHKIDCVCLVIGLERKLVANCGGEILR